MRPQIMPTDLFKISAGAILLATASALFLINFTSPTDLVTPHEPILGFSIRITFWIVGGIAFIIGLNCLFSHKPFRVMLLLAWFATNFVIYQIGLIRCGYHGMTGFLGGFSYAFGIPSRVLNVSIYVVWVYLFSGSFGALWHLARSRKLDKNQPPVESKSVQTQRSNEAFVRTLKISCTACGGHIKFPTNAFGETIPCPHCHATITLQKPKSLKMACTVCGGNIEFPEHAAGQIIPCPHCKMEIILKEPA